MNPFHDPVFDLFGPVWGASGVQGFFGEGYRFHDLLGPFKPDFTDLTFVAKTTTLNAREGFTPLRDDHTPQELLPASVHVSPMNFFRGVALNAWGLSGPGVRTLLATRKWQQRTVPFMISFMTVAPPEEQLSEVKAFVEIFKRVEFQTEVGVQLNLSCPNTNADTGKLVTSALQFMDAIIDVPGPVIVKVSVDMPIEAVVDIVAHEACDGVCVSNR